MEVCPSDQTVTLLSFGPRSSRPAPAKTAKKADKFSFKFRRRSKSAPRSPHKEVAKESTEKEINGRITYSANGETKLKNPDSPFKVDTGVQLVGFTSYTGPDTSIDTQPRVASVGSESGPCLSLDLSRGEAASLASLDTQYKAVSDSRTLSRTSKDIKMERERMRQERLGQQRPWLLVSASQRDRGQSDLYSCHQSGDTKPSLLNSRARILSEARDLLGSTTDPETLDLFQAFLREREERLGSGSVSGHNIERQPFSGSQSNQLIAGPGVTAGVSDPVDSEAATPRPQERIIPITITHSDISDNSEQEPPPVTRGKVRIIPVMVETEESSSSESTNSSTSSTTGCTGSTNSSTGFENGERDSVKMPPPTSFPSILAEMKMTHQDSLLKPQGFHHPSFANHFGLSSRLRNPEEKNSIFFSSGGIRDSFPGFPNFGNFPSFTPLLSGDRPFPDRSHFRDKSKADFIHKQRLAKSKSSVDYSTPADKQPESFRYVSDRDGESREPYGDSESESEDDDLDSVSVIVDRGRDRLSGTGSTHSNDSGISEDGRGHDRGHLRSSKVIRPRPDSAVPSELSLISDTSSCSETSDKIYSEARPLVVSSQVTSKSDDLVTSEAAEADTGEEEARRTRAQVIAAELVKTEAHYVAILHLIDQVFHFRVDQENRSQHMFPPELITTIFSNIKSIYKFHAEFLLPQLEERMARWGEEEDHQRIGDIMVKNAPFLKMYTEYVKNFDTAMNTINNLYAKNSKFAAIMDEIHALPECESLTLQHHMLTPIQRIPRYEMLLREYCQKLPEHHPDRADSESALLQVSQAAAHANDSMKRIEQFKKLLEVQESIGGSIDLVSPTREVIKEGKIVKISARTGDHQDRYLFLLSDLLLLCSPRKSMISGPQFSLRAKFDVDNLQVLEGDNLVTAHTFYVRDDTKSVELYTGTREEKEEWLEFLFLAIKSLYTRKSSLRVGRDILRPLDSEIGKRQPRMQRLDNVQRCSECAAQFSILKHKHNCRFCGAVFCSKCSDLRHPVPWDEGRKARICRSCHQILTTQTSTSPTSAQELPVRPKGLLEVPAHSPAVHSGWLVLRPPGSKSASAKRFFLLAPDFVLYSFRAEADTAALTATPVPGFSVLTGAGLKGDGACAERDRDRVIKMWHPQSKRTYYFAGNQTGDVERWAEVLSLASRAELPKNYLVGSQGSLQADNTSTSSTEYENG